MLKSWVGFWFKSSLGFEPMPTKPQLRGVRVSNLSIYFIQKPATYTNASLLPSATHWER